MKFGSLFAGVGGFDHGFELAGMKCSWQVEQNTQCQSVLQRHFPGRRLHNDVCTFPPNSIQRLWAVDLICGGFPCQDVSLAGKREGLAGKRSGLWGEFRRILDVIAPRWVCIENVPGLLSSWSGETPSSLDMPPGPGREVVLEEGSDFATVLGDLSELGYGWCYRIVDSQWYGVPQRRRRVVIVGHLGDARRAAEVLFEPESLPWDSPPSREAGARVAQTISPSTQGRGNASGGKNGGYPINLVNCLDSHMGMGGADDNSAQAGHLIAHTLRGEGHDASEYGTGRGVPLVADSLRGNYHADQAGDESKLVAYQCHGSNVGPMGTLRTGNGNESGGVPFMPVAFGGNNTKGPIDVATACNASASASGRQDFESETFVMQEQGYTITGTDKTRRVAFEMEIAGSLRTKPPGSQENSSSTVIGSGYGVRRLTPTECERLQGFPDDWTRYGHDEREMSDSARYRMLGNAVTVNVAEWIGRRIMEANG